MEKSISQEERIRRAEEIYSRRRYINRYGESLYRSGETRNRYQPQETRKIKGKIITKITKIKYFNFLKCLSYLKVFTFLKKGILYNKSWINPNGHNHPHTNLPIKAPMKNKNPTM